MVRQIPTAYMYNPGRSPVKSLVDKTFGAGSNICPKGAGAGELADIIVFGFVLESSLIEGRKYTFPGAGGQTQTRALKELQILPLQQEFERTLAVLSMVWGGKIINLNVSEEGGITFSTKHSLVDENGNPEKKSEPHLRAPHSSVIDLPCQRPLSGTSLRRRLPRPLPLVLSTPLFSAVLARAPTPVRTANFGPFLPSLLTFHQCLCSTRRGTSSRRLKASYPRCESSKLTRY